MKIQFSTNVSKPRWVPRLAVFLAGFWPLAGTASAAPIYLSSYRYTATMASFPNDRTAGGLATLGMGVWDQSFSSSASFSNPATNLQWLESTSRTAQQSAIDSTSISFIGSASTTLRNDSSGDIVNYLTYLADGIDGGWAKSRLEVFFQVPVPTAFTFDASLSSVGQPDRAEIWLGRNADFSKPPFASLQNSGAVNSSDVFQPGLVYYLAAYFETHLSVSSFDPPGDKSASGKLSLRFLPPESTQVPDAGRTGMLLSPLLLAFGLVARRRDRTSKSDSVIPAT